DERSAALDRRQHHRAPAQPLPVQLGSRRGWPGRHLDSSAGAGPGRLGRGAHHQRRGRRQPAGPAHLGVDRVLRRQPACAHVRHHEGRLL
ncbi:MAG: hypothetical protein AVDCRST_MAG29-1304, partial [uncultured Nocardioidaceae bacterium]